MHNVLFIVNSFCGRLRGQQVKECIGSLLAHQPAAYSYDMILTEPDIAGQLEGRLSPYDTVIVVGGDGTVSQVVQALRGLRTQPRLSIIPIGTGNDLAASLGILRYYRVYGLAKLLKAMQQGRTAALDILRLSTGRLFTNYFGIGNDAKISNSFNRLRLRRQCRLFSSKPLYGLLALQSGFYRIPFGITLEYRNARKEMQRLTLPRGICEIIISNIRTYAGGIPLCSGCRMDDGKFEVTIVAGLRQWFALLPALLLRRPLNTICPGLVQLQTDCLELTCSGKTFYQVDGEMLDDFAPGTNRLAVAAAHQVEVIVPSC